MVCSPKIYLLHHYRVVNFTGTRVFAVFIREMQCPKFTHFRLVMSEIDPKSLFGFVSDSPYAQLFVDIFNYTKPENLDKMVKLAAFENEKEEGEIDEEEIALMNKSKSSRLKKQDKANKNKHMTTVQAQLELNKDPARLKFLENLLHFMKQQGTPIR